MTARCFDIGNCKAHWWRKFGHPFRTKAIFGNFMRVLMPQ
jgi:hypothetical protein